MLPPLAAAIWLYTSDLLPGTGPSPLYLFLAAASLGTALLYATRSGSTGAGVLRTASLHVSLFLLGWVACVADDPKNGERWFGRDIAQTDLYTATVLEPPIERARTWRAKVAITGKVHAGIVSAASGKGLVYIYKDGLRPDIKKGDRLLLPGKWVTISNPGNPDEFDYAGFCRRNGYYHQQFLPPKDVQRINRAATPSVAARVHEQGMETLASYLRDSAVLGLLQAMLLGDERNFDNNLRQQYADTGIIHIVAISGSHVLIFFQFITVLLFWIRGRRHQFVKYLIAVPLVCFYVIIAGAPPSAVRAAVMFSIVAFGVMVQGDKQPLNQLAASAFLMLLYEPMWLFAVGFQLSFAAVTSLILFYRPVLSLVKPPALLKPLWQAAAASIAAELLVAPIVIYYFHSFPLMFLPANVLAYLFMSVVLILGLLLVLTGSVPFIASSIAWLLTVLVGLFHTLTGALHNLSPESFSRLYLSFPGLICLLLIIGSGSAWLLFHRRHGLTCMLAGIAALLCLNIVRTAGILQQRAFISYNISRNGYSELIQGAQYFPFRSNARFNEELHFVTRETHISKGIERLRQKAEPLITVGRKNLLVLEQPVGTDSGRLPPVDVLVIHYPVKEFNAPELQRIFGFRKLVLAGDQKRWIAGRWKDSCRKHGIPLHIPALDGAYVLR